MSDLTISDNPANKDLFGRESYVDVILETIESSDEGFNFGISARWGEGKSTILELLEPRLVNAHYKVIKFSPWKYTQDQISVKRKFIIDIYNDVGIDEEKNQDLYGSTETPKRIGFFEKVKSAYDKVSVGILLFIISSLAFALLLWLYKLLFDLTFSIRDEFLKNILIPFLAGFAGVLHSAFNIEVLNKNPKIESAEQFEDKFKIAIDKVFEDKPETKKVVIFIDDLDRCSHKEVEQVLTALFTFFSNPKCIYIITADHTVIRRYISDFLDISDEYDDDGKLDHKRTKLLKEKEATEYLKKIFQINLILPKVPPDKLEKWVKDLIKDSPEIQLDNPFADIYLLDLIKNFLEGNPRKIKHFIRTLSFLLRVVDSKIKNDKEITDEEKENLEKIKKCPELLGKILIFQDQFPDFYDQLKSENILLKKYESGEIVADQNLQKIIAQEPKFYDSKTRPLMKTVDPYYFIYFSGSTGFEEPPNADPTQIKSLSRSADFKNLESILSGLTDLPRNKFIEQIKDDVSSPDIQPPERTNVIRSLFQVVGLIEEQSLKDQKIEELFEFADKYEEAKAIQSVDIAELVKNAPSRFLEKLLTEEPYSSIAIRPQTYNGFLESFDVLDPTDQQLFISSISEDLELSPPEFDLAMEILSKVESKAIIKNEDFQTSVLAALVKRPFPDMEKILLLLASIAYPQNNSFIRKVVKLIEGLILGSEIDKVTFVINNIPGSIGKIITKQQIIELLVKRIANSNEQELEQILTAISGQSVRDFIGEKNIDTLVLSILGFISSPKDPLANFVVANIPRIFEMSSEKKRILNILLGSTKKTPAVRNTEILQSIWNSRDKFFSEISVDKDFKVKLESMKKVSKDDTFKAKVDEIIALL